MTTPSPCPRAAYAVAGFTLVEAMIVVAVVAILTAIAVPGYQDYVRRGNRAEARAALLQAAQWLERVATSTGSYLPTASVGNFPAELRTVPSATYDVSLGNTDAAGSAFLLSATPRGAQAADKCGALTLSHTGERGAGAPGSPDDLKAECWTR